VAIPCVLHAILTALLFGCAACGDDADERAGSDAGAADDGGESGAGGRSSGGAGGKPAYRSCESVTDGGALENLCSQAGVMCDLALDEQRRALCIAPHDRVNEGPNSCGGTSLKSTYMYLDGYSFHYDSGGRLVGGEKGGHGCSEQDGAKSGIDYGRSYGEGCRIEATVEVNCAEFRDDDAGR
jgi:hypothetical protein